MKKVILGALMALITVTGFSQSHNVKLNATSLIGWRIGELQYEYRLNDKIGLQLGAGAMIPRTTPFSDLLDLDGELEDGETGILTNLKMNGFRITPEIKFYLGSNADNPHGFYVAPFLRYYNYSLKSDYTDTFEGNLETLTHKTSFSAFGGGIGIGNQWLIADKVSIDVMWLGFGLAGGSIKTRFESSFDTEDWKLVEDEWSEELATSGSTFLEEGEIESDANGLNLKFKNPMPVILRSSVSVGYFF